MSKTLPSEMKITTIKHIFTFILIMCSLFPNVCMDFFANLDNMDIESKLKDLDKMLSSLSNDDEDENEIGKRRFAPGADGDLGDAFEALTNILGGDTKCIYECKNGGSPQPRRSHKPTSNGCGTVGIQVDVASFPGFSSCCNAHDICYDTCNNQRKTCDQEFQECLVKSCRKLDDKRKLPYQECKGMADIMYSGTVTLGCSSYLDAQENACTCQPRAGATNQRSGPSGSSGRNTENMPGSKNGDNMGSNKSKRVTRKVEL
ncbi:group XIIB secretory phospholipase A2-like protein [Dreissena polymorpha]|uniref:Group XIIA secretory phospholipase A2 n=1 Tax=Dreissena polymorpha TaxID=45954 RepID=A0A9D4LRG9_DREPO|nr:group XIIB secretory phospholipase A2-like protein [Dreissena polymorpha]KAH3862885.1 hypothetical protein DPMN_025860 [Dreissena polymorpha]